MKDHIVVHHSLTEDSGTVSWQAIRRYHTQTLGYRDIGYHYGIELIDDGYGGLPRYEILLGRMPHEMGAHCREAGMNRRGIGVCLVGNFDFTPPHGAQVNRLRQLCDWLMRVYPITPERVIGHREAGLMAGFDWQRGHYKTCPGRLFDLEEFRNSLRG